LDRRVKERLVGASILVVLVVLIVPELLSGPKRAAAPAAPVPTEAGRSITVDVAQNAAAPAPADPPAPAAQAAPLEAPASAPTSTDVPPAPEQSGGGVPRMHGAWALQLGSFANTINAQKLRSALMAKGYAAYLLQGGEGAALRYRVRIGPVADRGAAEHLLAKLKSQGYTANIVPPPR
jgi:DedD protein